MPHSSEFVDFLLEQMQQGGMQASALRARRMFGGYGIYLHDLMFALVADEVLYFKVGDNNLADFQSRELPAFRYQRNGKEFSMSYHEAPGEVLDDPEDMYHWASRAFDAALAAKHAKKPARNNKR